MNIGNNQPFFLIAGPCQIESKEHALMMATEIKKISDHMCIELFYKSSFDKANRTSLHGKRGAGLEQGMEIFDYLKQQIPGLNIITDIHTEQQAEIVAPHVDALQIPAFLCRQTDLLLAAGETGKYINIKKPVDLALWCGYLVAFYCLFRKANVVPKDSQFDPDCILTRDDIEIDEEGNRVLIFVNFSKTNQYMKKSHVIPVPGNSDPALDLLRHMKRLYSSVQVPGEAPAFSFSKKNFITHRLYTIRLKELLVKAGLEPRGIYSSRKLKGGGDKNRYIWTTMGKQTGT